MLYVVFKKFYSKLRLTELLCNISDRWHHPDGEWDFTDHREQKWHFGVTVSLQCKQVGKVIM